MDLGLRMGRCVGWVEIVERRYGERWLIGKRNEEGRAEIVCRSTGA